MKNEDFDTDTRGARPRSARTQPLEWFTRQWNWLAALLLILIGWKAYQQYRDPQQPDQGSGAGLDAAMEVGVVYGMKAYVTYEGKVERVVDGPATVDDPPTPVKVPAGRNIGCIFDPVRVPLVIELSQADAALMRAQTEATPFPMPEGEGEGQVLFIFMKMKMQGPQDACASPPCMSPVAPIERGLGSIETETPPRSCMPGWWTNYFKHQTQHIVDPAMQAAKEEFKAGQGSDIRQRLDRLIGGLADAIGPAVTRELGIQTTVMLPSKPEVLATGHVLEGAEPTGDMPL